MKRKCPPHRFVAAWEPPGPPTIYCKKCGDIRWLTPPDIDAPDTEKLSPEEQVVIRRDFGEPV